MKSMTAVVLAAGKGTRMKSDTPKVLHEIFDRPIIAYVLDAVTGAGVRNVITVAGFGADLLKKSESVAGTKIVIQKRLRGSGDALMTAKNLLARHTGDILVICGDTPLISSATLKRLIAKHRSSGASATVLTAELKDPTGYGRIMRDSRGAVMKIVEEEHARLYEEVINEVNVGTYCFKAKEVLAALGKIRPDNKKKELFLTDAIDVLYKEGRLVESAVVGDPEEMTGINSRKQLAAARRHLQAQVLDRLMASGVTIEDPLTTTIYPDAEIGPDTVVRPCTFIGPDVSIGARCVIGPFARLTAHVGVGDDVLVGNFVELVRSVIGDDSKVKHHTYLGDTTLGRNVNVGAGTITANYDGVNKNKTVIEDGAFIGVGACLVAPVRIGREAVLGAGCVVLKGHNVPKGATVAGVPARILHRKK